MLALAQWLLPPEMRRLLIQSEWTLPSNSVMSDLWEFCKSCFEAECSVLFAAASLHPGWKTQQGRGVMSAVLPLLLPGCWSSVHPLRHGSGKQPSPPPGQDPLLEQVHRELQEEGAGPWEFVLCSQRGLLQNLQGFILQLLCCCWCCCRRIHGGEDPPGYLWKPSSGSTQ